jgi:hypothetical protein
MNFFPNTIQLLHSYRMHILVFLVAGILALTFAHPLLLITDEMVTVNQLSQLHEGHQILYNEGKYGVYENGTISAYFIYKQNVLAYSLFLPLISLPAYWLLDLLGKNFILFIIYLWTFFLIALALALNTWFPEYLRIGKWRWTPGFFVMIFLVFFLNLYLCRSFPVTGKDIYSEVIAIVFTNIILFAFLAVMIYEICRTIFENPGYALFGTLTCISCSSYFFWTSFCKDHVLVAFLTTVILLLLVKLWHTEKPIFLLMAFVITGLLAWARPELAFTLAVVLCALTVYLWFFLRDRVSDIRTRYLIILAPIFTVVGAIPFFINNYFTTNNIFVPTVVLWVNKTSSSATSVAGSALIQQNASGSSGTLLLFIQSAITINPSTFFYDLYGIFFNPVSCSMGVFPLIPVFLVAILAVPILVIFEKIQFIKKDYEIIGLLLLVSLGIFFAYISQITLMNNDVGVIPDIRYLSPLYLPLTLFGLYIVSKIPAISDRPFDLIKGMFATWCILIPVSVIILGNFSHNKIWVDVYPLVNAYISMGIYVLSILFLITAMYSIKFNKSKLIAKIIFVFLCALPLIWQISMTFITRHFAMGLGGFTFWIPLVLHGYISIFI